MNKTELVKKIAEAAGLSGADAKKALDATTGAIKEALVAGDKVQLVGFGTFATKERPARQGVNPSTGKKIQIAAKTVVKFNPGAEFEAEVNK
ncbi:MAG: HU family DNA-binding protein [Prevotella sp.]|nr:HU family DNA-binding protein [Prevotella sp.]